MSSNFEKEKQSMSVQIKESGLILYTLKNPKHDLERLRFEGTFDEYLDIAQKLNSKIIYLQNYMGLTDEAKEKISEAEEIDEIDESMFELAGFSFFFKFGDDDLSIHSFDVGATELADDDDETDSDSFNPDEYEEKKKRSSEIAKKIIEDKIEYATLKKKQDKLLLVREYLEEKGFDESEYVIEIIVNDADLILFKKRKKGTQMSLS